jgi:hypothetical protein
MDRRIEGPNLVTDIFARDELRREDVEDAIRRFWEGFLERFSLLETGRRPIQNLPLDRRFILRLEAALDEPITVTQAGLLRRYRTDNNFRTQLNAWMNVEQGWELSESPEYLFGNLDRAARLASYVLVTRLVFYECSAVTSVS